MQIFQQEYNKVKKFYAGVFAILLFFLIFLPALFRFKPLPSILSIIFVIMCTINFLKKKSGFIKIPEKFVGIVIDPWKGRTDEYLTEGIHFLYPWQDVILIPLTIQSQSVKAQSFFLNSLSPETSVIFRRIACHISILSNGSLCNRGSLWKEEASLGARSIISKPVSLTAVGIFSGATPLSSNLPNEYFNEIFQKETTLT